MPIYTLPGADLSLLQVVEFHATKNPDHTLFRYDSASAREGYEEITWRQAGRMFDTTAQIIRRRLGDAVDHTSPPIVGILAATGAILYASLIFGTLRAGCTVFPLSTRNSDVAIAHLIAESGIKYLLVSQDTHMQEVARKANNILHSKNIHINMIPIPTYEEISANEHADLDALPPLQPIEDERVLIIAHSSGTTSFPKVIPLTHKYCIRFGGTRQGDFRVQSSHGSAMFHAMGFLSLIRAVYSGMIMSLFPPTTHAVIATPERVLASALATKSTTIVCAPMFLENWAQDPYSVEKLRTFSNVIFSGGPLAQPVGDALERNGVKLTTVYGITEIGGISQIGPADGNGWQYFQFPTSTEPVLVPLEADPTGSLFQLIIKQCATNCLAVSNTEVDGVLAFDTNTAFRPPVDRGSVYPGRPRVDRPVWLPKSMSRTHTRFT